MRAAVFALALTIAFLLASVGVAAAAAPSVTLEAPIAGSSISDHVPLFSGKTDDVLDPVTVDVYSGLTATGTPLDTLVALPLPLQSSWSVAPEAEAELPDGQYVAVAKQTNSDAQTGTSAVIAFTVDTTAPAVSLEAPPPASNVADPILTGEAGVALGDQPTVSVTIYRGPAPEGEVAASAEVTASEGKWSYPVASLSDGTYTAQATQSDATGNVGKSVPATFVVDTIAPTVGFELPAEGAVVNSDTPTFNGFAGQAGGDFPLVILKIYADESQAGTPVQTLVQTLDIATAGASWSTGTMAPALEDGSYTAVAEQSDDAGNLGTSTRKFTVLTPEPIVTLTGTGQLQREGRPFTGPTPSFTGSASNAPEDSRSVTVKIYEGPSASGNPVRSVEGAVIGSTWTTGPVPSLPDGTYTAVAEQSDSAPHKQPGLSQSATFNVDADAPLVSLSSLAGSSSSSGESETVSGSAGTAAGDLSAITVQLFAGSTESGLMPLEVVTVQAVNGSWSAAFAGLRPGAYTVQAEQDDDVGNVGSSVPVTFTVSGPAVAGPTNSASTSSPSRSPTSSPVASFRWFPAVPHTGEAVSLASTSTDSSAPIVAFAWDPTGAGAFQEGGAVVNTSFSTPGAHVVHLRVTDANGLSSVVAETITVSPSTPVLMQPFPVVRIAGSATSGGIKISLLTVQAPVGATITVSCHGPGCPAKPEDVVPVAGRTHNKGGVVLVAFRRFERALRAGAVLEIRVSEQGKIGKYTRFSVRHGKLPSRLDTCLAATGASPMACPS